MQRGLEFSATTTATLVRNPVGVWPSPSARLRHGLILRVEQVFFIIIVIITTAAVAMKKCPLFCCFMAMKFVLGSDAICTCSEDLHVFFFVTRKSCRVNATLRESGRFVGLTKFPEGKKVTPVMVYETLIYDFCRL